MVGYPRLPAFADAPACMDVASAPTSCLNPGVPPVRSGEQLCDLYLFFGGWRMSGDSWMYPYQRTPMGNAYISPISTMGTLLGVHPIVP